MKQKLFYLLFLFLTLSLAAQTVYVTKTGAKYHTSGCRYLRSSSIPIALSDAIKSYSPCSICRPPTQVTKKTEKLTPVEPKGIQKIESQATKSTSGETYNGREVLTGPRGGKYYINKNGNKTYIRKK